MASKDVLIKRIEGWKAKRQKQVDRIDMYAKRAENALKKLSKATGDEVTFDNFENYNRSHWDLYYSVHSALDYQEDAKKEIKYIDETITDLKYKLNAIIDKEKAFDSDLESIFLDKLSDFKQHWFDKMEEYYYNLWEKLHDNKPKLLKKKEELEEKLHEFRNWWRDGKYNEYKRVNDELTKVKQTLYHDAFKFSNPKDYFASMHDEIEQYYNNSIKKLVDKCDKFNIDRNNVTVHNPSITQLGIDVIITDGTGKIINARMIWAAEYSEYMVPHVRYIVTEKRR